MDTTLDDVLYFVHRFNHLLPYNQPVEQDLLNDEFLEFQMMEEEDIPASIWRDAVIRANEDGEYHRMDRLWVYLGDLNPIEHIWDILSRSIHQRQVAPQTVQELADALVQVWEEIPQETIRHLIRSMPRHCREVIQAHGFPNPVSPPPDLKHGGLLRERSSWEHNCHVKSSALTATDHSAIKDNGGLS
ncbi:hypothetical protein GJAV_G00076470 [Gymnothorax javanicus]|nr:hypothetical protein GJAV_G00076470 [Gymnothorax javanicus]